MDLNLMLKITFFAKTFNINLNKIIWLLKKLNTFSKLFQKHFRNIFQKIVTKAIIKQAGVAHVIPFAPY
jgi:hypothetical protein